MPKVVLEVPETEESITIPIASEIARQFAKRIGVPDTMRLMMPFEDLGLPNLGSTMDQENNDGPNRLHAQDRLDIVYEESYADWNQLTRSYFKPDNKAVFIDNDLRIYMRPNYQQVKGTLNCTLRSQDHAGMQRWIKSLKNRVEREEIGSVHQVNYHIPIPPVFMYMLCGMYNLRENKHGHGQELWDYLSKHFTKGMAPIMNQAGRNPTYVIKEDQISIVGWFDFGQDIPKPQKLDDTGAYVLEFTYNYYYDRCDDMMFEYPLMVHNQMIPKQFYDKYIPYELENYLTRSGISTTALSVFQYDHDNPNSNKLNPGLPIPYFDQWTTPKTCDDYVDIMRILCQVDEENPSYVGKIDEVGEWYFRDEAALYFAWCKDKVLSPYQSLFYVRVFEYNGLLGPKDISINSDFELFVKAGMNPRKMYRVVISLLSDPTHLSEDGLRDLAEHGCFAYDYFAKMFPNFVHKLTPPTKDCKLNLGELIDFVADLSRDIDMYRTYKFDPFMTYNALVIRSRKEG